jgi:XTP/dITP diphosphohydrolase
MKDVPADRRTARFVAAITLVAPGVEPVVFQGEVEGLIAGEARGDQGFGYDPIFYYPPFGRTFGEAAPQEKDTVSHRARALAKLERYLRERGLAGILERTGEASSQG